MDVELERRRGDGLFNLKPSLVHPVARNSERDLLSGNRSSANPGYAVPITDGEGFFHEERRDLDGELEGIEAGQDL